MRIGIPLRQVGAGRAIVGATLEEALAVALAGAEPVEAIEVSLGEAVGLVLAEPVVADCDLPPFDRASAAGYAVRAGTTAPGTLLRLAEAWSLDGHEVEPGEAAAVEPGEAMPVGADAVLDRGDVRPDAGGRVLEVVRAVEVGRGVARRGSILAEGTPIARAGTRVRPAMVGLLAAQGCVHPPCHRRVRVAIVAVGEHLVGPADAPVLHHERNAASLAVGTILIEAGAMVHDLGAVCEADLPRALDRATSAHVALVLGHPGSPSAADLLDAGIEPVVAGLALEPGGDLVSHGLARDDDAGRVACQVVRLPLDPVAAVVAATLFVRPLLSRLQGDRSAPFAGFKATWDGPRPARSPRLVALPATLAPDGSGRLIARPVAGSVRVELPELARADGLALFPPGEAEDVVSFVPFSGWPVRDEA